MARSRGPELKLLAWRANDNKRPLWGSVVDGEEVVRVLRDDGELALTRWVGRSCRKG